MVDGSSDFRLMGNKTDLILLKGTKMASKEKCETVNRLEN